MGKTTHATVLMRSGAVVEVITDDEEALIVTLRARRFGLTSTESVVPSSARRLAAALIAAADACEGVQS